MTDNVLTEVLRRDEFLLPEGVVYLDGNSLGPLTRRGQARAAAAMDAWRRLGVAAWTDADPPWYTWPERLAAIEAEHLLGAQPGEVALTGQTSVNLHQLLATFYRPTGPRRRIVVDALAFPTDRYAAVATLARAGLGEDDLSVIRSRDGRTLALEDVFAAIDERTAIVLLASVLYRSGQLLDVAAIAAHAHAHGALLLVDLSHSIGILPHALDAWGVDFAVWCNYKYLSGGPGAVAGLFVARRHQAATPALAGWWGSDKRRQFEMAPDLAPAPDAGRFQIGTPPILALAPLAGSLELVTEVPMARVRAASLALTERLIALADERLGPLGVRVGTPRNGAERGGHVALEHPEAARLALALRRHGVVPDFRPPDAVRLCPHPLYTTDEELERAVAVLRKIIVRRDYEAMGDAPAVT